MGFEADVSLVAFEAFAEDATLEGSDVRVIIDKDIEVMDEDGGVKRVAYLVHAIGSAFDWVRRDTVIHDGTTYQLLEKVADDGIIIKIEAVKVA